MEICRERSVAWRPEAHVDPYVPRFFPVARPLPSVNTATPTSISHVILSSRKSFDRHDIHGCEGNSEWRLCDPASRGKCKAQTRLQHALRLAHSRSNYLVLMYRWFSRVSILFTALHPVG
ncbi:hypothetical protein E4T39_04864 [Aureobasidium subglaciale]|nr:hypothetical protein E4T39_04864 [Aureobasidium subglaciale]